VIGEGDGEPTIGDPLAELPGLADAAPPGTIEPLGLGTGVPLLTTRPELVVPAPVVTVQAKLQLATNHRHSAMRRLDVIFIVRILAPSVVACQFG
jgi:hypothetical protein